MIRIPYPIPEPERSRLIAAGSAAVASKHEAPFHALVVRVIDDIVKRYGVDMTNKKEK